MVDKRVNDGGRGVHLAFCDMDTIGMRVKGLRNSKDLSQEKLGAAIGVGKQTVSSWENDAVKNMELRHLFALADALNVDPRWLALGHRDRLCAPIQGFPISDTGKFRIRRNARHQSDDNG
jgi:transcriptional regulator with XRE-family HTH domain